MTWENSELPQLVWCQVWQVTLLILGVAVAAALARRRPHLVYLLWMLVILKSLTPPLWSSVSSVFSWAQSESLAPATVSAQLLESVPTESVAFEAFDGFDAESSQPVDPLEPTATELVDIPPVNTKSIVQPTTSIAWTTLLFSVWAVGAVVMTIIVAIKWWHCLRIVRTADLDAHAPLQARTESLARRLGLRRNVRVAVLSQPLGPAVCGLFRPVILLPQVVLTGKRPAEIEPVLAHELIHVRRGDALASLFQVVAQILWWFHPLVWWANRQAYCVRERCCDEEAVAALDLVPADYARSLLDVLETKHRLRPIAGLPGLRAAELTSTRLENIMQRSKKLYRRTPIWCWLVILLTAAVVLPGRGIVRGQTKPGATPAAKATNERSAEEVQAIREKLAAMTLEAERLKAQVGALTAAIYLNEDLDHPGESFWQINLENSSDKRVEQLFEMHDQLKSVGKVRELMLFGNEITDKGFAVASKFPDLEQLAVYDTQVSDAGLIRLGIHRTIKSLNLIDSPITGVGLRPLSKWSNLTSLSLRGDMLSDKGMKNISALSSLLRLSIESPNATGGFLEGVGGLKELEHLRIVCPKLDPTQLSHLKSLPNLNFLSLRKVNISDSDTGHLKEMVKLKEVVLNSALLTDAGLVNLYGLTNLEDVILRGCDQLSTEGLESLSRALPQATIYPPQRNKVVLRNGVEMEKPAFDTSDRERPKGIRRNSRIARAIDRIESLGGTVFYRQIGETGERVPYSVALNNTDVTDDDLGILHLFPYLTSIDFESTNIGDAGIAKLARNPRLQRISARNTLITGTGFKELRGLKFLEDVALTRSPVTDAGVAEISKIPTIRSVRFGTEVTDAGMVNIGKMTQLQSLILAEAKITNDGLRHLKNLQALSTLWLFNTQISDAGLQCLGSLKNLEHLRLDGTKVTGSGFHHLAGLPRLSQLSFTDSLVDDDGLLIVARLRNVGMVSVLQSHVTPEGIENLRKTRPNMRVDNRMLRAGFLKSKEFGRRGGGQVRSGTFEDS